MATQQIQGVDRLDGMLGFIALSMTNYENDNEPEVTVGSKLEIGGSMFEVVTGNESFTGWGGISNDTKVYMYASAAFAFSFSSTAATWDNAKQGYYNGTSRCIGTLYKDAAGDYTRKNLVRDRGFQKPMIYETIVDTQDNKGSGNYDYTITSTINPDSLVLLRVTYYDDSYGLWYSQEVGNNAGTDFHVYNFSISGNTITLSTRNAVSSDTADDIRFIITVAATPTI